MNEEELRRIVARGEGGRLELKESFGAECIETACAFANAGGGYIVIGVDDSGKACGGTLRAEGMRDYCNRIATATEPSVAADAEAVEFGGREVAVLKVMENPLKPVAYKGRCYARKGSVNHQMTPAEIAECHLKTTGVSMDAVTVPGVAREDLDMGAVRRYMDLAVRRGRRAFGSTDNPWETLMRLEWVRGERDITRAAYLLFAKEPQRKFPQAVIHAGAFKAGGVEILDSRDFAGNVQDQTDAAMGFIKRNIRCAIVNAPGSVKHETVWDYPLDAVREALVNAVCHRDYGYPHDIQLKVYEDSIVVSSPGSLPFDMPLEMLRNPVHASRPRNKLLAQALYDIGAIEHYGRGIQRIVEDCERNGNPRPEWVDRTGEFLTKFMKRNFEVSAGNDKVSVKGGEVSVEKGNTSVKGDEVSVERGEVSVENEIDSKLFRVMAGYRDGFRELAQKVVKVFAADSTKGIIEAAEMLGVSERSVRRAIKVLKENGLLKREGAKKGGRWVVVRI